MERVSPFVSLALFIAVRRHAPPEPLNFRQIASDFSAAASSCEISANWRITTANISYRSVAFHPEACQLHTTPFDGEPTWSFPRCAIDLRTGKELWRSSINSSESRETSDGKTALAHRIDPNPACGRDFNCVVCQSLSASSTVDGRPIWTQSICSRIRDRSIGSVKGWFESIPMPFKSSDLVLFQDATYNVLDKQQRFSAMLIAADNGSVVWRGRLVRNGHDPKGHFLIALSENETGLVITQERRGLKAAAIIRIVGGQPRDVGDIPSELGSNRVSTSDFPPIFHTGGESRNLTAYDPLRNRRLWTLPIDATKADLIDPPGASRLVAVRVHGYFQLYFYQRSTGLFAMEFLLPFNGSKAEVISARTVVENCLYFASGAHWVAVDASSGIAIKAKGTFPDERSDWRLVTLKGDSIAIADADDNSDSTGQTIEGRVPIGSK